MIIKNLMKVPVFKRLIPSVFKKYIFFSNNYFKEKKIEGIKYLLDTRHLIDRNFYLRENYEDDLFFLAKDIIIKNKVNYFLDIGSCWGIYSLRLSKTKKLKIMSFDPIYRNISRLKQMIKINNLRNITTYHTALGDKIGKVKFYGLEEFTPNYTLYGKGYKHNGKEHQYTTICKIDRLDNIIKIKNKILYLKVDVEKHEYFFLMGAKNIIKNNKIIIQIEIIKSNKKKVFNFFKKEKFNFLYKDKKGADYIFSNFIKKNPQNFHSEGSNFV